MSIRSGPRKCPVPMNFIKKAGGGSVTLLVMSSWEALGPAIRVYIMTCTAADRVTLSWQQHSLKAVASCSRIMPPPPFFFRCAPITMVLT